MRSQLIWLNLNLNQPFAPFKGFVSKGSQSKITFARQHLRRLVCSDQNWTIDTLVYAWAWTHHISSSTARSTIKRACMWFASIWIHLEMIVINENGTIDRNWTEVEVEEPLRSMVHQNLYNIWLCRHFLLVRSAELRQKNGLCWISIQRGSLDEKSIRFLCVDNEWNTDVYLCMPSRISCK